VEVMSSKNKTLNLELNQWNGNEYPKRSDFIEDNKKIDEAYKELKDSIKDGGKVSSVNSKIGDVILKAEDIKTAAGITVENKLNELFQFADNGKKNIETVIGYPLATSDTFDSMKSKIQTLKNTFASNLTSKGQSSSGSDTLNNLINKVANIKTEKKWAEGNFRIIVGNEKVSVDRSIYINWKPSVIIVIVTAPGYYYDNITVKAFIPENTLKGAILDKDSKSYITARWSQGNNSGMYANISIISDTHFKIINTIESAGATYDHYWLAIEL